MTRHDTDPPADSRRIRIVFAIVLLLAVALRLIRLGTFSFWHDEVHNLIASEDLYALVVHGNLISNHPPLPYILVALWRAIGLGANEFTMRLLPMLFGVAAVAAVFALGKRLFDARAGLFAAFLLAISPLHIHHSQDLKEYIYLPFIATVMVLFFYRGMESNRWRDWLSYGVLAGLACYTEIFVGPLLVAINVWALPQLRRRHGLWKRWAGGNALGALLFLPWLSIMIRKAVGTMVESENWWVPPPSLAGVGFYFKAIAFGYTAAEPWFHAAFVLFAVLLIAGTATAWRANRRAATLLVVWAVVPVAIVYAISLVTESIFLIRAMLPYAIAVYVLVGVGLANLPTRAARGMGVGLTLFIVGTGLVHHYYRIYPDMDFPHRPGTHPPRDYRRAAEFILDRWRDGDAVVHTSAATWLPFYWYGFRGRPQYFAGVGQRFIRDIELGNPRNTSDPRLEYYWPREPAVVTKDARRVWFVFAEWERKYLEGNATNVYRWMDAHFSETGQFPFMGLDVVLYERPRDATPLLRNHDDGVTAEIVYAGRPPYTKTRLDNALTPVPVDLRRGNLRVRWEDPENAAATGRASFLIENAAGTPITARVMYLGSAALVDLASLDPVDPTRDVWHVRPQHNPNPPPQHFETNIATANFATPGRAELRGTARVPAGSFDTLVYVLGTPGSSDQRRAEVAIAIGDNVVYPGTAAVTHGFQWAWQPGTPVALAAGDHELRITAECAQGREPCYADIGYLALVKRPNESNQHQIGFMDAEVESGAVRRFQVEFDPALERVDVWVTETTGNDLTYRLYLRKPPSR